MGWPQTVFGVVLVATLLFLAVFYGRRQVRLLRRLRAFPDLPEEEAIYERRQAWRRLVCSGLMLLLAAQASVFRSALCASRRSVIGGRVAQAWIALLVQHASYGSWMSPLFLLVCVLVVFGDRAWPSPEPIVDQSEAQLWPQPV